MGQGDALTAADAQSVAAKRASIEDFQKDQWRVSSTSGVRGFMHRVVCTSRVVSAVSVMTGSPTGLNLRVDDSEHPALDASCTPTATEESYDGAINIVGADGAVEHEEELPLDCFQDQTSRVSRPWSVKQ